MWIHDLRLLPRFVFVFPTMISATLSKTFSKQSMDVFPVKVKCVMGKKKEVSSKRSYSRSAADDNGDILRCQMLSLLSFFICSLQ